MKHEKYYPPSNGPCIDCYYARMRTDICGIYCTGGFVKPDGTCERFKLYLTRDEKQEARNERTAG